MSGWVVYSSSYLARYYNPQAQDREGRFKIMRDISCTLPPSFLSLICLICKHETFVGLRLCAEAIHMFVSRWT